MKWALIVVGVVVTLALVVVAIGYSLPVAHTARRSVVLAAPPSEVWAAISDVGSYPAWRDDVERVEMLAPVNGQQAWREKGSNGDITYAMTRAEPPTRMGTRISDDNLPFGGAWDFEITPVGTGSRVSITEHGEVYNPVFRFVSRFIMGHTTTIDGYLRALGAKFGETVVPEADGAPDPARQALRACPPRPCSAVVTNSSSGREVDEALVARTPPGRARLPLPVVT